MGIPVQDGVTGQLVSLMSGRKIVTYGTLLNHSKTISLPVGGSVKELKVTNTHAVVSVSRAFIEGMIIEAQKHTLQQLGPTPFTILVPLKSLYTRAATEPYLVSQTSMPVLPNNIPRPRPAEDVLNADNALASQALEEDLDIDGDCNSEDNKFSIQGDNVQSNNDQVAEPIQAVSTSIEEDIEMAIQSDDEYDTPESRAQLADLMDHTLAPASNHDLHQIAQSHTSGIQLNYIQPMHHDKSPLASHICDMYRTDYSGIFQRCTLPLNNLHVN